MFNFLVSASLRNRLFVLAATLILIVYGAVTLRTLPVDVFPDLNRPTVTLVAEAEGLGPEEVEQLVTFPLETAMNGMPGVVRVRSVSGVGLSIVYIEFDWGTNIFLNRQQVTERLGVVREQLPRNINPQMAPITSIMGEIMLIAVASDEASPKEVREVVDWVMRPRLLTIPGIAQVIPIGGEVRQYRVTLNLAQMQRLDITRNDIETALKQFGANTAGGFIGQHSREYLIRNLARTTRIQDLETLTVTYRSGVAVRLGQVASVDRWLVARQLAEATPAGDIAPKPDMMRRLRQAETERLAGDLARRLGASYVPAEPGRQIVGIYDRSVTTPTGKLAVIRHQDTFTLAPWRPALEPFKGRAVMGSSGRPGSPGPSIGAARRLGGGEHRTNRSLPGKRVARRSRSARKRSIMNNTNPPLPPAEFPRPARNKGKLTGPKPPLRPGHVWSIRAKLQLERRTRDVALFNLAIDSKLRGCDLVALRVDHVAPNGYAVDRATVRQSKTGRPVRFELTKVTRHSLDDYLRATGRSPGQCLFPGRRGPDAHLTTRQYARLVSEWVSGIGLDPLKYATHSMRRNAESRIMPRRL